jgi:hypothetical protein
VQVPVKRKPVPPPDERYKAGTDKEVRQRLSDFVRTKFGDNWSHFARVTEIPLATLEGWKPTGNRVPQMKHLRKLAQHRLSLDWLVTGLGEMTFEHVPAQTDRAALLHLLLPVLQRLTNAGEITAEQAFDRLLLFDLGPDQMLELAATGLLSHYREIVRDLNRWDERKEMHVWLLKRLDTLDEETKTGDAAAVRAVLDDVSRKIREYVPEFVRLGEIARKRLRADAENAEAQIREAERRGWSPAAFTMAAEVANAVRETELVLTQVAQVLDRPRPDVQAQELLRGIGSRLMQLELYVQALQERHAAAVPTEERGARDDGAT